MEAAQFKTLAQTMGVDLTGVAPVERFAIFSPQANPLSIQPQTRSVIVLGFSIPRGALQGMETGTAGYTLGMGIPCLLYTSSGKQSTSTPGIS